MERRTRDDVFEEKESEVTSVSVALAGSRVEIRSRKPKSQVLESRLGEEAFCGSSSVCTTHFGC